MIRRLLVILSLALWPLPLAADEDPGALVRLLNERLLSEASATLVLDAWCAERRLAPEGSKILAERVRGQDKPADAPIRALLGVGAEEPVHYRRVRLRCGEAVLSEADNWYLPAALTPEMNQVLETTDTSFGRVVAPLGFTRETLVAELLWQGGDGAIPAVVLRHRARLLLPDGRPFSALVESYGSAVLGR